MRAELLPPLPARRAHGPAHRHLHQPPRNPADPAPTRTHLTGSISLLPRLAWPSTLTMACRTDNAHRPGPGSAATPSAASRVPACVMTVNTRLRSTFPVGLSRHIWHRRHGQVRLGRHHRRDNRHHDRCCRRVIPDQSDRKASGSWQKLILLTGLQQRTWRALDTAGMDHGQ
jgi:hypothetical protein